MECDWGDEWAMHAQEQGMSPQPRVLMVFLNGGQHSALLNNGSSMSMVRAKFAYSSQLVGWDRSNDCGYGHERGGR